MIRLLCALLVYLLTVSAANASSPSFYLAPSTIEVEPLEEFSITLVVDPDSLHVAFVQFMIEYDSTLITFVSLELHEDMPEEWGINLWADPYTGQSLTGTGTNRATKVQIDAGIFDYFDEIQNVCKLTYKGVDTCGTSPFHFTENCNSNHIAMVDLTCACITWPTNCDYEFDGIDNEVEVCAADPQAFFYIWKWGTNHSKVVLYTGEDAGIKSVDGYLLSPDCDMTIAFETRTGWSATIVDEGDCVGSNPYYSTFETSSSTALAADTWYLWATITDDGSGDAECPPLSSGLIGLSSANDAATQYGCPAPRTKPWDELETPLGRWRRQQDPNDVREVGKANIESRSWSTIKQLYKEGSPK